MKKPPILNETGKYHKRANSPAPKKSDHKHLYKKTVIATSYGLYFESKQCILCDKVKAGRLIFGELPKDVEIVDIE